MPDPASGRAAPALPIIEAIRRSLWIQGAVAVALHAWLAPLVRGLGILPMSSYAQPILVRELIVRRPILGLVAVLLLLSRKHVTWRALDLGRHARLFVMAAAALLVWPASTADYNFFFDQGYILDRVVLVGLWALIYVHPAFVVPVVIVATTMFGQLLYPLPEGWWQWPNTKLPLDFLTMFCGFLAMRPLFRRHRDVFILITCVVVASQYVHAGLNKLMLGPHVWTWVAENHPSHMVVGAYINGGWLRPLSPAAIYQVKTAVAAIDPLFATATVLIECGMILLLLHPRFMPWVLSAAVMLHVGILALTGIFFWRWMLFDLMLALWLSTSWRADDLGPPGGVSRRERLRQWLAGRGLFSARTWAVFAILVLVASTLSSRSLLFAWWDTPYIHFSEIRGVGESGREYVLDSRFFSPYDMIVHAARFYYLQHKSGVIGGTYGVADADDYEYARAVENARPDDLAAIRHQFGTRADPALAAASTDAFKRFVSTYVNNAMRHGRKDWWLSWISPPFHYQTWRPANAYDLQEPLREVYVQHEEFLDWQGTLRVVGSERVLDVPLR